MPAALDDIQAVRAFESIPVALPAGLDISWLGVSGYCLTYEGVSIFVDPYVSRVPLRALVLRRKALPDRAMLDAYAQPRGLVAGTLVGHTHFDHAVDAPAISARYRAPAYGSSSPYRCGPVYGIRIEVAGTSLYHQGSADLDDGELAHNPVDVFLAGVAGREVTPRYWERVLPRLDPRVIVPTHYDDFFIPLGGPEKFVQRVNLAGLADEIAAVSTDATLAALKRVDAA